jgi:glycosyltransferase involved in cell wall biosynthesis
MNFPASTGYAWAFIQGIYQEAARRLTPEGVRTFIAYPSFGTLSAPPSVSPATAVELPLDTRSVASIARACRWIRQHNVRVLYLSDRRYFSPAYLLLRAAGLQTLVVHDHSSGTRTIPTGLKRFVKQVVTRARGFTADRLLTVSDFVRQRDLRVGLMPPAKVRRIWNGIAPPDTVDSATTVPPELAGQVGLGRPIVMTACRASEEKGVEHLLRAMIALLASWPAERPRPFLAYLGGGPKLEELRAVARAGLDPSDYWMPGYVPGVWRYLMEASLVVVPSVWQDAMPLGVLEPMHLGKPIVATAVGGIPEMVRDGKEGILIPPGSPDLF